MNDYVIVTDSTTDLPAEIIEKFGITVIPLMYNIDGKEYYNYPDARQQDIGDFYRLMREGKMSGTAQINVSAYLDVLEPILKRGRDVLNIAFSSALSGTYNSSKLAVEELSEKYPDRRIYTVDSLSASMGEGLLVYNAALEKEKGMTIEELRNWVIDNRLRLCHWFTVDDLNHLKRGGRVSATAALIGTMLGIKPVLHVDDLGRLIPTGKVRGRRQSLDELVHKMEETCENPQEQIIMISHGDSLEDAKIVERQVREKLKVKDVIMNYIGPVIGAHSGPGTIALFFLGSHR